MKKIYKLTAILIISSMIGPFFVHAIAVAMTENDEAPYKNIAINKAYKNASKQKINSAKKRTRTDDYVLQIGISSYAFSQFTDYITRTDSSASVPPAEKYSVWSKSTFS